MKLMHSVILCIIVSIDTRSMKLSVSSYTSYFLSSWVRVRYSSGSRLEAAVWLKSRFNRHFSKKTGVFFFFLVSFYFVNFLPLLPHFYNFFFLQTLAHLIMATFITTIYWSWFQHFVWWNWIQVGRITIISSMHHQR